MSYTIEQAIDDVLAWSGMLVVSHSAGRPETLIVFREAFRKQEELAVMADPDFFSFSDAFTSGSYAYPSNHRQTVLIETPTARSGAAAIFENSEWYRRKGSTRLGFTADNPGAKLGETGFTLSPDMAGVQYSIKVAGHSALDTESTDLETLIPRPFIQSAILDAVYLMKQRHLKTSEPRSGAERYLEIARNSQASTMKLLYPSIQAYYNQPVPGSTVLQKG